MWVWKENYRDLEVFAKDFFDYYNVSLDVNKFITAQAAIFTKELINSMYHTKIPHMTSVLRCRQKLQQENKELRGKKYEERHLRAKQVKEAMINWDDNQANLF